MTDDVRAEFQRLLGGDTSEALPLLLAYDRLGGRRELARGASASADRGRGE